MRVLIIPEDVKKDQYILKPIIRAMLQALGRSHVKLWVGCARTPVYGASARPPTGHILNQSSRATRGCTMSCCSVWTATVKRAGEPYSITWSNRRKQC